jgi:Septum formation initiator
MASAGRRRKRRRPIGRWLAVSGLVVLAFLYYRPLTSYFETKHTLEQRASEVRALEDQNRLLKRRLARSGSQLALVRKARELSLVKPGERLFIVKGIPEWRRRHSAGRRVR